MYNLGTGNGTSVLEMVDAFEKASGKVKKTMMLSFVLGFLIMFCVLFMLKFGICSLSFLYQKIPLVTAGRRPGDAEIVYASTERAESELNWK